MILWTVTRQSPLSIEFSAQEYQSGLPCPSPGDLPNPGIKLTKLYVSCILYHKLYVGSPVSQAICNQKTFLTDILFPYFVQKIILYREDPGHNLEAQLKSKCGPDDLGHLRKYGSCLLSICYLFF